VRGAQPLVLGLQSLDGERGALEQRALVRFPRDDIRHLLSLTLRLIRSDNQDSAI
jgi:hypothetical protein